MVGQVHHQLDGTAQLGRTLEKSEAATREVQRASDSLSIIGAVLEQELPDEVQVGEVAQAIEQTGQLEKKLSGSAEKLAEVNEALGEEIRKRKAAVAERDQSRAQVKKLESVISSRKSAD